MELKITRRIHVHKYSYSIEGCTSCIGKVNFTYGFLPVRIVMHGTDGAVWEIKQTCWPLKLINALPILNFVTFTPFNIYYDGVKCGNSKNKLFEPVFSFMMKEDVWEIRAHSNNMVSLMKNNEQVALYTKKQVTELERNEYMIKYNCSIDVQMLLLYAIFADMVFYSNHNRVSYYRIEKDYVIHDNYIDRTKWEPST